MYASLYFITGLCAFTVMTPRELSLGIAYRNGTLRYFIPNYWNFRHPGINITFHDEYMHVSVDNRHSALYMLDGRNFVARYMAIGRDMVLNLYFHTFAVERPRDIDLSIYTNYSTVNVSGNGTLRSQITVVERDNSLNLALKHPSKKWCVKK